MNTLWTYLLEGVNLLLNEFLTMIKTASVEAVNASDPTALVFGKVVSISPLKINIEPKLTLAAEQLVLARNVTDFVTEMTIDHMTENHTHTHEITDTYSGGGSASLETHNHGYAGRKSFLIHNSLIVGDEVLLIRMQGGQKYIVIDRVVAL